MYVRPPRPSVYLTLRLSVIRQTSRPAHMYFCLHFFLYLYASTPAYPSHSYAQFLPDMSVFFASIMSVYHVHSYVSVCLSTTFMYTIRPFHTFLRLSVDLRVFMYVYFHVNILHVSRLVRSLSRWRRRRRLG